MLIDYLLSWLWPSWFTQAGVSSVAVQSVFHSQLKTQRLWNRPKNLTMLIRIRIDFRRFLTWKTHFRMIKLRWDSKVLLKYLFNSWCVIVIAASVYLLIFQVFQAFSRIRFIFLVFSQLFYSFKPFFFFFFFTKLFIMWASKAMYWFNFLPETRNKCGKPNSSEL